MASPKFTGSLNSLINHLEQAPQHLTDDDVLAYGKRIVDVLQAITPAAVSVAMLLGYGTQAKLVAGAVQGAATVAEAVLPPRRNKVNMSDDE